VAASIVDNLAVLERACVAALLASVVMVACSEASVGAESIDAGAAGGSVSFGGAGGRVGGTGGAAAGGAAGGLPAGAGGGAGASGSGGVASQAACDQGGQDASSVGAEAPFGEAVVGLCRRVLGCPSVWSFAPPPMGYQYKGTPNHKLLWRVWWYGYAQAAGSAQEVSEARTFLIQHFEAQLSAGHQALGPKGNEVLNVSHYQIWSNGMTCARLLAVHYADSELEQVTGRWWRHERALYDLLEREGSIDAPGARYKPGQAGPSDLRDTLFAMLRGSPILGNAKNPNGAWWSNYYNVAAWTLRELLRLGDDLGGAAGAGPFELPRLSDPLHVRTRGNDFVYEFPRLLGALEPLFWVARIDGVKQYAPYTTGTPVDNPYPAPELPGATVTIVPGVQ
jgi:hypothetical protein